MTTIANLLVSKKPISTGAWALYDYDEQLAKKFRLLDRFENPYLLYKSGNGKLYLPRGVCPIGDRDLRTEGYDIDFDLKFPPRNPEQDRVIAETFDFLNQGLSGVVQCPTGFGKTYLAYAVTALMRRPTLVVCTKEDIYEQWIEGAKTFLGLKDNQIGQVRQNTCTYAGRPFTVAMIHSLAIEGRYPPSMRHAFGLVHYDECHRLPADSFMKVAGMFSAKYRLGWSATADRSDGKQIVFQAHIGPTRVTSTMLPMIPEVYRYRTAYKLPMVTRRNPKTGRTEVVQLPHTPGRVMHVISNMAKDEERNRLIAKLAYIAWKKDRKIILFSDQLEHLENLEGRLVALGVKHRQIGWYIGGISKQEKRDAMAKQLLLATYKFASEGTDTAPFDMAIMATPRSDIRQIIGRVLRELPGKKQPVVIDMVDLDSYVFKSYASTRMKFYHSIAAKVTDVF